MSSLSALHWAAEAGRVCKKDLIRISSPGIPMEILPLQISTLLWIEKLLWNKVNPLSAGAQNCYKNITRHFLRSLPTLRLLYPWEISLAQPLEYAVGRGVGAVAELWQPQPSCPSRGHLHLPWPGRTFPFSFSCPGSCPWHLSAGNARTGVIWSFFSPDSAPNSCPCWIHLHNSQGFQSCRIISPFCCRGGREKSPHKAGIRSPKRARWCCEPLKSRALSPFPREPIVWIYQTVFI